MKGHIRYYIEARTLDPDIPNPKWERLSVYFASRIKALQWMESQRRYNPQYQFRMSTLKVAKKRTKR